MVLTKFLVILRFFVCVDIIYILLFFLSSIERTRDIMNFKIYTHLKLFLICLTIFQILCICMHIYKDYIFLIYRNWIAIYISSMNSYISFLSFYFIVWLRECFLVHLIFTWMPRFLKNISFYDLICSLLVEL